MATRGRAMPRVLAERHLRIAEAARIVGVSPSALRLWERQGLLDPVRGPGGHRLYAPTEVDRARHVARLRQEQLNAPAIRRMLPRRQARSRELRAADGHPDGTDMPPAATDLPAPRPAVGARLRALRERSGLTLRAAAARSGLSPSFVSSVERGVSGASLTALRRLAEAYGTSVPALLRDETAAAGRLVRPHERRLARLADRGIRIEDLANRPALLESQLFVLAPGATSDGYYAHAGEELMFVLAGRLAVWLDEREYYELAEGDALTFPSTLSHRFQALGASETRLVWINTPPTF